MDYVFINQETNWTKKEGCQCLQSFRSYLSNLGYNGIVCFPSFNNQSIEAWPQDRNEKDFKYN